MLNSSSRITSRTTSLSLDVSPITDATLETKLNNLSTYLLQLFAYIHVLLSCPIWTTILVPQANMVLRQECLHLLYNVLYFVFIVYYDWTYRMDSLASVKYFLCLCTCNHHCQWPTWISSASHIIDIYFVYMRRPENVFWRKMWYWTFVIPKTDETSRGIPGRRLVSFSLIVSLIRDRYPPYTPSPCNLIDSEDVTPG